MKQVIISREKNDYFSRLNGLELQSFLNYSQENLLTYRERIYLPGDVTFGAEIECEKVSQEKADNFLYNQNKKYDWWFAKYDGSLRNGGVEVVSPVLTDKEEYWNQFKEVCAFLTQEGADTLHNAGGHVHVGASILGDDMEAWRHFLKVYAAYENVIFRFIYGDKINGRNQLLHYAHPVGDGIKNTLYTINTAETVDKLQIGGNFGNGRFSAINFYNVDLENPTDTKGKNTIEFRSPNGTTNEVVWQNNINMFTKMLLSARNKVMNEKFLDYKLEKQFLSYSYMYSEINLKNALEFVDLIFDNNLDKLYFLRQYLKNFQDGIEAKDAVYAERFVK